ncbi:BglG family transcription antiterminator [Hespellia stercorisuis]|uniref:Mannitol operon transcriptional antiterminator n=1 Tax=Hespellia stercorisuis DSM 15480 TaxID=1121950 RepID=A0A1M6N8Q2_9FIRM|nr:BglG family transcription antiterminator [Hespellia stercorisuis]SHJ92110.1 mannitol operon transcriptional antiterminator [Hespellia stercorisuis DSM 15480]
MNFTPRQVQILFLLIKSSRTISKEELSENLQISKRTLFRELKGLDKELEKYSLYLDTQSKKGLILSGEKENKEEFLSCLEKLQSFEPRNRKERQKKLLGMLIQNQDVQKTFYYAQQLGVSEATINHDLEDLQPWFDKSGIHLVKRTGYGVAMEYEEADFRRLIMTYIQEYPEEKIQDSTLEETLKVSLADLSEKLMEQFTVESVKGLLVFLEIAVDRIKNGHHLKECAGGQCEDEIFRIAGEIAERLETSFSITCSLAERQALHIFLKSAKRQLSSSDEYVEVRGENISLREIVYHLTDVFGPELSFELKTDEVFIDGLMTHLRPAVTRMLHGIPVQNTLLKEVQTIYPDVYERSGEAAKILGECLNCEVSEEETGYLAMHFGGAIVRLREKNRKKRRVDIGVMCASGIGISNLIASRLLQYFGNRIHTKILTIRELPKLSKREIDFIVSSFDVKSDKVPVIQVEPFMKKHDFELIDRYVESLAVREKVAESKESRGTVIHTILQITKEVDSILADFRFFRADKGCSFDAIISQIGEILGRTESDQLEIAKDLREREALSTQVIPEYEIVFLHCRTDAVADSKMIILLPEGNRFEDPYFFGAQAMVVMLINKKDERETLAISAISNAVFSEDDFLEDIKSGEEKRVQQQIEKVLDNFLQKNVNEIYEQ